MKRGYKETEIGEIPVEWEVKELIEVAEILMGQSPPSVDCNEDSQGYPFFQGNADFGQINPIARKWIIKPPRIAPSGSILISVRAPVGDVNIARVDSCIGRGLSAVVPNRVTPDFSYYYLQNQKIYFLKMGQGSTFDAINREQLDSMLIPVPPLSEQKKIAEILSSVDEAIRATQAVIDQTKTLKQGLLNQLLTKGIGHKKFKQTEIGEMPVEWEVKNLGSLVNLQNGLAYKPSDWKATGIPIIRIQNLNGGFEYNYFQGDIESQVVVDRGDYLFSWSGSKGTSFGPHFFHGPKGVLNQHIFKLEFISNISKVYLFFALQFLTSRIESEAHGGAGLVHITKKNLESISVPVPPLPEQMKIVEILSSVDETILSNSTHFEQLKSTKSGLMQDLLTGKKRVALI